MFQKTVSGDIKWAARHTHLKCGEKLRTETLKSGSYSEDWVELWMTFKKWNVCVCVCVCVPHNCFQVYSNFWTILPCQKSPCTLQQISPLFSTKDLDNYSSIFNFFSFDYSAYSYNGIISCEFICYWLLLLSIMFSGPPTLYHISALYYFILQNSIPFHILFIHSSWNGHLGHFHILTNINNAALFICAQILE